MKEGKKDMLKQKSEQTLKEKDMLKK